MMEPRDRKLFELAAKVVEDGLAFVERRIAAKRQIRPYDSWPTITWSDDGMPDFSFGDEGRIDYKDAFNPLWFIHFLGRHKEEEFDFDTHERYQELMQYIRSQPSMSARMIIGVSGEKKFDDFAVRWFVEQAIDRYIHIVGNQSFDRERFLEIYLPLEAGLLLDELPIEDLVPILLVTFPSDSYAISEGITIAKLSEPIQLARARLHHGTHDVNEYLCEQASHALTLTGWVQPNSGPHTRYDATSFPLQIIDTFFASLRIVTALNTGYAQLLIRPLQWARSYSADLPPLEGVTIRKYPPNLSPVSVVLGEHFPKISDHEVGQVRELFAALTSIESTDEGRRLGLVIKRLNSCYMREEEEDAILDATIGLEILLSDGDTQEVTHKLALRLAALSSLVPGYEHQSAEIFRKVKNTVYPFRSAVVHGHEKRASKTRQIKTDQGDNVPAVRLAVEYLGMAVRAVAQHPEYLDPLIIDTKLLLGP